MNERKEYNRRYLLWCRLCGVEPPLTCCERLALARDGGRVHTSDIRKLWYRFMVLTVGIQKIQGWIEDDNYECRRNSFVHNHQSEFDAWLSTLEPFDCPNYEEELAKLLKDCPCLINQEETG